MLKLWDMASLKTSQVIQNANYDILVNVMKIGWLLLKIQICHKQLWRHRKKYQKNARHVTCESKLMYAVAYP